MEFLVRTENLLPPDTPDDVRVELRRRERERAMQLREAGVLERLWRVPGRGGTVGLYEATDPAARTSLPMWKWRDVHVEALAPHPQERDR